MLWIRSNKEQWWGMCVLRGAALSRITWTDQPQKLYYIGSSVNYKLTTYTCIHAVIHTIRFWCSFFLSVSGSLSSSSLEEEEPLHAEPPHSSWPQTTSLLSSFSCRLCWEQRLQQARRSARIRPVNTSACCRGSGSLKIRPCCLQASEPAGAPRTERNR